MRHFPVFLDTRGKRIVVAGAEACAVAKLRLLLKTEAQIDVYARDVSQQVRDWAAEAKVTLHERALTDADMDGAILLYAAEDDEEADLITGAIGKRTGVTTLVVDNLEESDFITPAIVDREPVTVAIGTEGAAPVLARKIKAEVEEMLPQATGVLARIGQAFRDTVEIIPQGPRRRAFWTKYYFEEGPK